MPSQLFTNKRIILGVTGSIAAYKAADLASKLTQAGAQVDVILTQAALQFVTPLTFQSVTGRPAFVDADLWGGTGHVTHIGLGKAADLLLIAPASANTMARLAHGIADNLLCVTALAAACPLVIAPAMDGGMFSHPATQANLALLKERGAHVLGPVSGHLASGLQGVGRMMEPADILAHVRNLLAQDGPLAGRHVVVTAGGTQEPLDPVRVLANHSSGKQGFALAQAALDLGAQVTLVRGPVSLPDPLGAQVVRVQTAEEMLQAVLAALPQADALVMAAAVADFRPAQRASQKIKKNAGEAPTIVLEHTPDILRRVAEARTSWPRLRMVVGFAAESQDLLDNAAAKLQAKRLDMIAANDITAEGAGFGVDTNRVTLLFPDGRSDALPLMTKEEVAQAILQRVMPRLALTGDPNGLDPAQLVFHICDREAWQLAQADGYYRVASLKNEGFIHMSTQAQIVGVANRYYQGQGGLDVLWIDPSRVKAEIKWEPSSGDVYPHLYGPLPVEAVVHITQLTPGPDGEFTVFL